MPTVNGGWKLIGNDLDGWNRTLLATDAHLYQYPYWNEPLRQVRLSPQYLVYMADGVPRAYVCLLRVGPPRLRLGIVRGGPVALHGDLPDDALGALVRWAGRAGYVFVRFSHADERFIQRLSAHGRSERVDALPFYPPLEHELLVEQLPGDDETAARFQPVARRNIRDAVKLGYEIRKSETTDSLEEAFPLFGALNARKGAVYSRPMSSYVELMRLAARHRSARVYTALLDGRAVQVLLVVRDRDLAHYVIGALDVDALSNRASPGCLLHWHAMRDFHREGARIYNLGLWGTGGLQVFKSKFRPTERVYPPPLTLILQPSLYAAWTRVLPWLRNSRPHLEKLIATAGELRDWAWLRPRVRA